MKHSVDETYIMILVKSLTVQSSIVVGASVGCAVGSAVGDGGRLGASVVALVDRLGASVGALVDRLGASVGALVDGEEVGFFVGAGVVLKNVWTLPFAVSVLVSHPFHK